MSQSYLDGYRNGHLDHYIGILPLVVALTYPLWKSDYATGYYDGYFSNSGRGDETKIDF